MAAANSVWTVLPHGPIEILDTHLWRVEGSLPNMPLKRVMCVARLSDGGLVIHNAIPLDDGSMKRIEQWGEPGMLVVPNGYHRLDARVMKNRYPNVRVVCPRGCKARVEKVVPVDATVDELTSDPVVRFEHLDGTALGEAVMIVKGDRGTTLVFTDAIFNMPHQSGLQGLVFRYITASTGGPRVSRIFRLLAVNDKQALSAHFERLAEIEDLHTIVVSHQDPICSDPARVLRSLAREL